MVRYHSLRHIERAMSLLPLTMVVQNVSEFVASTLNIQSRFNGGESREADGSVPTTICENPQRED